MSKKVAGIVFDEAGASRIIKATKEVEQTRPGARGWEGRVPGSDWTPRIAQATENIPSLATGAVQFYSGSPDNPGDEDESEEDEITVFNRFSDIAEDDWLLVGMVGGNWEIISQKGGSSLTRGILLDDLVSGGGLTAGNAVPVAVQSPDIGGNWTDTGTTIEGVRAGLPSFGTISVGTVVWMTQNGGGWYVVIRDCAPQTGYLEFLQQPTDVSGAGHIIPAITVRLLDGVGNLLLGNTTPVTITFRGVDNTGSQLLLGTTTIVPNAGVATFGDLIVSFPQAAPLHLQARAFGFAPVTSNAFTRS